MSEDVPTWETLLTTPTGGDDLSALLDELADRAREFSGARSAAIGLFDRSGRVLHWLGVSGALLAPLRFTALPVRGGAATAFGRAGLRPLPQALQEELGSSLGAVGRRLSGASLIPVRANRRTIGLLILGPQRSKARLTPQAQRHLDTLLNMLPLALDDVRALKSLRRRVEAQRGLLETASELQQALDPGAIYRTIAEGIARLVPYTGLSVLVMNRTAGTLPTVYATGRFAREVYAEPPVSLEAGIAGAVARTGRPEILPDIDADPRVPPIPRLPPTHQSMLVLPLRGRAGSIGVLQIYRPSGQTFSEEDLEIAMLYADHGAAALENAQLFSELTTAARESQARAERLARAFEITQSFFLIRELPQLLQRIVEVVVVSFGFRRASIMLYDAATKRFRPAASTEAGGAARLQARWASGYPEELALLDLVDHHRVAPNVYHVPAEASQVPREQGLYQLSPEAAARPRAGPGWWHESDRLAFTLIDRRGSLIGILSPEEPTDRRIPSKEALEALGIFANLASIAIENARLSEEEAKQLAEADVRSERLRRLLALSSTLLTSGDVEAILEQTLEAVTKLFGFHGVAIVLRTPDGQAFRAAATLGIPDGVRRRMQDRRIPPEVIAAEMDERHRISQRAYYVPAEETTREALEYFFVGDEDVRGWTGPPRREPGRWNDYDNLLFPIWDRHGGLLGVIYPESPVDGQVPTAESVSTLEIFASLAALALDLAIERTEGGGLPPLGQIGDLPASGS